MKWLIKGVLIFGGLACCLVGSGGTYLIVANAMYGKINPDLHYDKIRTLILPFLPFALLLPAGLYLIWATLRYGNRISR